MPELFDTSAIPDQPEYWDELSQRVSARALRPASTFRLMAESRLSWAAAGLAAAAAFALLLLPPRTSADTGVKWAELLAPSDQLGKVITATDRPPELGELLRLHESARSAR